jgi:hypothetical protein
MEQWREWTLTSGAVDKWSQIPFTLVISRISMKNKGRIQIGIKVKRGIRIPIGIRKFRIKVVQICSPTKGCSLCDMPRLRVHMTVSLLAVPPVIAMFKGQCYGPGSVLWIRMDPHYFGKQDQNQDQIWIQTPIQRIKMEQWRAWTLTLEL